MIDHRGAETLMAVAIDFALTPDERATLDAHLAGCDRCLAIGAQLRRDALALRDGPSEDAPSEIRVAVEAAAAAAVPIDLRTRRYLFLVAAALLMALAVGGAIVVGSGLLDLDGLSVNPSPPLASPAASESSAPSLESSPTPAVLGFPANTLIAFHVSDQVSSSIHTVEPNGANDRTLAEGSQAAWAPDGGSIAYACPAADDTVDICLLGADGSGQAILIDNADRPQFSPDGGRLLFGDGSGDTWVANADGSQPVRVANGQGTWSPDGSWIMLETIGPCRTSASSAPTGLASATWASVARQPGARIAGESGSAGLFRRTAVRFGHSTSKLGPSRRFSRQTRPWIKWRGSRTTSSLEVRGTTSTCSTWPPETASGSPPEFRFRARSRPHPTADGSLSTPSKSVPRKAEIMTSISRQSPVPGQPGLRLEIPPCGSHRCLA